MVKQKESLKELKHQARRHSIKEGIYATSKSSFGDKFISPFAIAINSSNSIVALLSSVAGLLNPLSQLFSSKLIEKYPRKKIVIRALILRAIIWPLLIALAVLFYKGIFVGALPIFLLIFFALYNIFIGINQPAWFSWQGDIVDKEFRGRWFSKRQLITGFISAILAIAGSFFLDYFKNNSWTMFGFMILFLLAFIFRILTLKVLKKQYEPKLKLEKADYFSFWDFIINARKNNFGRFAIFRGFFSFAITISSSLWAVYLLRYLEFSYSMYMIIAMAGTIFSLLVLRLWGKLADKYGNYRVLCITIILIPITPILWTLSSSKIYLIFIPALISGISSAGFTLVSGNFVYDNVSKQKRGLAISYYNLLIGIGTFLGAGLGALLIKFLQTTFIEPIILIFIIGAISRMLVAFFFIPQIKEIRKTKGFKSAKTLKNIVLKEAGPTLHEEIHQIALIKEYLRVK